MLKLVKQQKQRENIIKNVQVLSDLYGLDSEITIFIQDNIVVYGIMNKNKTFYSKNSHRRFSTIALYHKSLTIAFLSDLSKEISSIVNQ